MRRLTLTSRRASYTQNSRRCSFTGSNICFKASNFIKIYHDPIKNYYKFIDNLGRGSFGVVRKAVHKVTSNVRAIKTIKKTDCTD